MPPTYFGTAVRGELHGLKDRQRCCAPTGSEAAEEFVEFVGGVEVGFEFAGV